VSRGDGLARLRQALEDHGSQVRGDSAQCPAHEDRDPSLSIGQGNDGAVLHCHAGCDTDAVLEALGMSAADLFDEPRSTGPRDGEVIATYVYTDERGAPLFYVDRRAGKRFVQYHLAADGSRVWNLRGVRRVPYRLPVLLAAARSGLAVYLTEGEKDADAICAAGGIATCNPMGAGKWRAEYARYFDGAAKVIIVADRDEPGRRHAEQVARSLRAAGTEAVVVEAAEGKDAADHLAAGHGLGGFRPAAQAADAPGPRVIALAEVEPERVEWLWPGYLPRGKVVILDGDPDLGKSAVSIDLAARISTGSLMPDGAEPVKGAVLLLSAEDGLADTIRPRLDAAGGDPAQVVTITEVPVLDDEGKVSARPPVIPADVGLIEQVITARGVVLVIIDVLMAYLSATVNAHRDQDIRRALHPLSAMAGRTGCTVLVIRHLNKSGGDHALYRGGGSIGIVGAARAAFMVGSDPEDDTGRTRILASVKHNLSRRPPSLAYRLDADELHGCVRVSWQGVSERRAADLLAERGTEDERTDRDEAVEWLTSWLIDNGGEGKAGEIIKAAEKDGIGRYVLHRARRRAGVTTAKSGMRGGWLWRLDTSEGGTNVAKGTEPRGLESSQPSATFEGQPGSGTWPPGTLGAEANEQEDPAEPEGDSP
jgi:putative DNA primase/helicase